MTQTVLRTRHLIQRGSSPSVSHCATIRFDASGIVSVDSRRDPSTAGDFPDTLVMPALANAHDHGRGLKTIAYGVADAPVELWVPASYTLPALDPYALAAVAFARMARSGITSVVHCHLSADRRSLLQAAGAVRRAAEDVGIRIAFVVPLRDRNRLGYGPDEAILACADPADRTAIAARFLRPLPSIAEQMDVVDEVAEMQSDRFIVQYGPIGAEWCSDALLEAVADRSERSGRRVHMHLLESRYQRAWTDREYKEGVVGRLRAIGLASPRLTVAHGTWLRPPEMEQLAACGVTVSVNTSSNLRLRSGIAPVAAMKQAGLRLALGLDALALDDDDDMLREMRLAKLLHGGWGFEEQFSPAEVLSAAIRSGGCAVCGESALGDLIPGAPADLIVLDHAAMAADIDATRADPATMLLARARKEHVRSVYSSGVEIVRGGVVTGIDEPGLQAQLSEELKAKLGVLDDNIADAKALQKAIVRFLGDDSR